MPKEPQVAHYFNSQSNDVPLTPTAHKATATTCVTTRLSVYARVGQSLERSRTQSRQKSLTATRTMVNAAEIGPLSMRGKHDYTVGTPLWPPCQVKFQDCSFIYGVVFTLCNTKFWSDFQQLLLQILAKIRNSAFLLLSNWFGFWNEPVRTDISIV